jgi:hypothetical protein
MRIPKDKCYRKKFNTCAAKLYTEYAIHPAPGRFFLLHYNNNEQAWEHTVMGIRKTCA